MWFPYRQLRIRGIIPSLLTTQMVCLSIKRNKEMMMTIVVCEYIINLGGGRFKRSLVVAVSDGVKDKFQLVHKIIHQNTGTQFCHSCFKNASVPGSHQKSSYIQNQLMKGLQGKLRPGMPSVIYRPSNESPSVTVTEHHFLERTPTTGKKLKPPLMMCIVFNKGRGRNPYTGAPL